MTSRDNQQYLTVELFNSKMETFMAQIRFENEKLRSELRSEFQAGISTLQTEVRVNSAKIEMLSHTFYWGFAIMTIVITFVVIFIPYFLHDRKEKKETKSQKGITEERVQELIANTLNKSDLHGQ